MKNEKFCFSKGTGLIALVGIVLVAAALLMGSVSQQSTSTDTRAGLGCTYWSGKLLPFVDKDGYTVSMSGNCLQKAKGGVTKLMGLQCISDVWKTSYSCSQTYQDTSGTQVTEDDVKALCKANAGKFVKKLNSGLPGKEITWACSYYTGGYRKNVNNKYTDSAETWCKVETVNAPQCLTYEASVIVLDGATPVDPKNKVSQSTYCQNIANKVAEHITYEDFAGNDQVTGCKYYKPTGTPRNPNVENKSNCRVDVTYDSTKCVAVGSTLGAGGPCSTKRCWNGELAGSGNDYKGGKCECYDPTSVTEIPHLAK